MLLPKIKFVTTFCGVQLQRQRLKYANLFITHTNTGEEVGSRPEDKAQLAHPLKVKEMNGLGMPMWNTRFTVLCGSRMFVFAGSRPRGKPNLVLDLRGGRVEEHKSKKFFYCLKITASHREVRLAFDTGLEQTKWLERAAKVLLFFIV